MDEIRKLINNKDRLRVQNERKENNKLDEPKHRSNHMGK